MPFSLLPGWQADAVTDISAAFLEKNHIRLVMLDFDNTIVPYTTDIPTRAVQQWLQNMQKSGIALCVVSNSHNSRVPQFCREYGIDCVTHAKKPFSRGIRQCLQRYDIPKKEAILVGDQIYTDTLGGNCAGVRTVLVKAIHNHTIWLKLRHVAELPFIWISKNRRI